MYSYLKDKNKFEIKGNFNKLIQDIRAVLCIHQMQNDIFTVNDPYIKDFYLSYFIGRTVVTLSASYQFWYM